MTMKKEQYFIGMDGGGTKTHAVIADSGGTIRSEHIAGPSNFQIIGVDAAAATIYSLIRSCCESVGCAPGSVAAIVCGLTGAGRVGDQKRMADGLKKYARSRKTVLKKVMIESDARIALEGAFNGNTGIILIAGTGSIAFGKDSKGTVHRVGGWGRILGDEGSGYYIGRLGLTAVAHEIDGRGVKTSLTKSIAKKFGLTDQTAIINAVYKNSFDVAAVAPLVLTAAEKKDRVCRTIIEQSVLDLSDHIEIASKKIDAARRSAVRSKIPVAFIGGLIANDTILYRLLSAYIHSNIPGVEVISPMSSPAHGAVLLATQ